MIDINHLMGSLTAIEPVTDNMIHDDDLVTSDEVLSPSLENLDISLWLEKIHHKLYQRVIEASYPSKFSENSNIIISLDKKKFSTCELVDKRGNIYVFKC